MRRARKLALLGVVLLAPFAAHRAPAAAARPVTVEELLALAHLSDIRFSPDGTRLLFVVSHADFEADAWVPVLWEMPAEGGEPRRLTYGSQLFNRPRPVPQVAWSPDGSRISYLALVDGLPQVVALDAAGGESRTLTHAEMGVAVYRWAPDSRALLYLSQEPPSEDAKRREREKRSVLQVDRQDRPARVWVVEDVDHLDDPEALGTTARPRPLTPLQHFVSTFDVSPDGRSVAYAAAPGPTYMQAYQTKIHLILLAGGEPRPLVDRPGMNDQPLYSPDGATLAFVTTAPDTWLLTNRRLATVPSAGGEVSELHRAADQWVGEFLWAADSRSLYYLTDQGTAGSGAGMFEQQLMELAVPSGAISVHTRGRRFVSWLSVSRDGKRMAFKSSHATSPGDVYMASTETWQERRISDLHPRAAELDWGSLDPISWRSFDGMEIWGLLMLPPGYREGTRIPVVVYCHGGPIGGFAYGIYPQFPHTLGPVDPYPSQALASAGIGVLLPMPRGGSGYGEKGYRMILGSWGEGDYRDIMAGVDHLIERGIADPKRLGVMGASYGGFMTSWIVTQTDRFVAASTGASVTDLEDLYALSDAGDFLIDYFGKPWEEPETYRQHSPVAHASRVVTPLLIQHGENDIRVPVAQARKFYKLLKDQGKTVELDIYPRGGHVTFEPDMQREVQQRNVDWFTRWLLADPTKFQGPGTKADSN